MLKSFRNACEGTLAFYSNHFSPTAAILTVYCDTASTGPTDYWSTFVLRQTACPVSQKSGPVSLARVVSQQKTRIPASHALSRTGYVSGSNLITGTTMHEKKRFFLTGMDFFSALRLERTQPQRVGPVHVRRRPGANANANARLCSWPFLRSTGFEMWRREHTLH